MVKAIWEEVSMSVAESASAIGMGTKRLGAIEAGLSTSRVERDLIARAMAWRLTYRSA